MKVTPCNSEVNRLNIDSHAHKFTINAQNPQAFKILSDKLYSNKIMAIIRELCTNAYDSHIAAGKGDISFIVHLPTINEPWFAVEDQGLGMSRDTIKHVYTSYFTSTKTESNDFVGVLGLGSKSPFSYCDAFTIISTWDQERTTYSVYYNESGYPTIQELHCECTDAPNGVIVSVPVQSQDISKFELISSYTLVFFDPAPIIQGRAVNTVSEKIIPILEGINWIILDHRKMETKSPKLNQQLNATHSTYMRGTTYMRGRSIAVQGCVSYPIDIHAVLQYASDAIQPSTQDCEIVTHILNSGIILNFDVGSLDVTPSREALSYNDATCKNIFARALDASNEIINLIQIKVDKVTTLWEASKTFNEIKQNLNGSLCRMLTNTNWAITWYGKKLGEGNNVATFFKDNLKKRDRYIKFCDDHNKGTDVAVYYFFSIGNYTPRVSKRVKTFQHINLRIGVGNVKIVYNDHPSAPEGRARQWIQNHRGGIYNTSIDLYIINTDDPVVLSYFQDTFGGVDIQPLSSIPYVRPQYSRASKKVDSRYKITKPIFDSSGDITGIVRESIDPTSISKTGTYCILDNNIFHMDLYYKNMKNDTIEGHLIIKIPRTLGAALYIKELNLLRYLYRTKILTKDDNLILINATTYNKYFKNQKGYVPLNDIFNDRFIAAIEGLVEKDIPSTIIIKHILDKVNCSDDRKLVSTLHHLCTSDNLYENIELSKIDKTAFGKFVYLFKEQKSGPVRDVITNLDKLYYMLFHDNLLISSEKIFRIVDNLSQKINEGYQLIKERYPMLMLYLDKCYSSASFLEDDANVEICRYVKLVDQIDVVC